MRKVTLVAEESVNTLNKARYLLNSRIVLEQDRKFLESHVSVVESKINNPTYTMWIVRLKNKVDQYNNGE